MLFLKRLETAIAIAFVLVFSLLTILHSGNADQAAEPDAGKELVVPYGEWDLRPVELVVTDNGRVMLRVWYGRYEFPPDEALVYLRAEVLRLTAGDKPVAVADSRFRLRISGPPIWGPHMSMGPAGYAKVLFFAEHAHIGEDGLISAWGDPNQVYNGYKEWKPFN